MLIGIDWGGTKIEGIAMEPGGRELLRLREETPRHDYVGCITKIKQMIEELEAETGQQGSVGIGIPGSLEPVSRLARAQAQHGCWRSRSRRSARCYPAPDAG